MSIGNIVRQLLGKKLFFKVAYYYRRFFVDLALVASVIEKHLPKNASVLDIGGGDGALLNEILHLRPDVTIAAVDISNNIGGALVEVNRKRVRLYPETSTFDNHSVFMEHHDVILISDVMHHIPEFDRIDFVKQLSKIVENRNINIIIKDIEPGYIKSYLSLFSDKFISNDPNTKLISATDMKSLFNEQFDNELNFIETDLIVKNRPNYCIVAQNSIL